MWLPPPNPCVPSTLRTGPRPVCVSRLHCGQAPAPSVCSIYTAGRPLCAAPTPAVCTVPRGSICERRGCAFPSIAGRVPQRPSTPSASRITSCLDRLRAEPLLGFFSAFANGTMSRAVVWPLCTPTRQPAGVLGLAASVLTPVWGTQMVCTCTCDLRSLVAKVAFQDTRGSSVCTVWFVEAPEQFERRFSVWKTHVHCLSAIYRV